MPNQNKHYSFLIQHSFTTMQYLESKIPHLLSLPNLSQILGRVEVIALGKG